MKYDDIYTEAPAHADTLAHLGPLAPLAGKWYGEDGVDTHPEAEGPVAEPYHEAWTFEVIDAQNNGPQVFYGLRYHVYITKPGELNAFHDQVGYLLWEPETKKIYMTLAIPRGEDAPYLVPLNFGAELAEEKLVLYFHCAREGTKLSLLRHCPAVSFSASNLLRVFNKGTAPCGYTTTGANQARRDTHCPCRTG